MIFFVTALPCEAQPLIQHYKLKRVEQKPFAIFRRESIWLIVSGIGQVASAAATTYLYSYTDQPSSISWWNVGIAGHSHESLGAVFLADKIVDQASENTWYPPEIIRHNLATKTVTTVAKPETSYPDDSLFEMEAAGFYATASRFTTGELIHTVKIVSDNKESSIRELNKAKISSFVAQSISTFAPLCEKVQEIAVEMQSWTKASELKLAIMENWHFSATQQAQLQRLLEKWQIFFSEEDILKYLEECKGSKQVITKIRDKIENHPIYY